MACRPPLATTSAGVTRSGSFVCNVPRIGSGQGAVLRSDVRKRLAAGTRRGRERRPNAADTAAPPATQAASTRARRALPAAYDASVPIRRKLRHIDRIERFESLRGVEAG